MCTFLSSWQIVWIACRDQVYNIFRIDMVLYLWNQTGKVVSHQIIKTPTIITVVVDYINASESFYYECIICEYHCNSGTSRFSRNVNHHRTLRMLYTLSVLKLAFVFNWCPIYGSHRASIWYSRYWCNREPNNRHNQMVRVHSGQRLFRLCFYLIIMTARLKVSTWQTSTDRLFAVWYHCPRALLQITQYQRWIPSYTSIPTPTPKLQCFVGYTSHHSSHKLRLMLKQR